MFYVSVKIFADINFERNVKESKLAAFEWENQIFLRTGTAKTLKRKQWRSRIKSFKNYILFTSVEVSYFLRMACYAIEIHIYFRLKLDDVI